MKKRSGICVSQTPTSALALAPGLNLYLTAPAPICFYRLWTSSCIYRPWLIRIGNSASQRLPVMLLLWFLLSNFTVTVIIGKNETKSNLSKKRWASKTECYKTNHAKEKSRWNQLNQINENKNSFGTSFEPMWHEIKAWCYLEFN